MGDIETDAALPSADISKSSYASQTRKLLDAIDQIRDIGGQQDELSLPRIVVIGNQSAGKSSLIEAIARINVPRGGGTCTRCPTEIRLRRSNDSWRCAISLRYEYDSLGETLSDSLVIPFGEDILNPNEVEIMLRRAQIAILNDAREPSSYLELSGNQMEPLENQRQFSKNVICIEVSGPLLTDLTFVDLPGIIQHHPTDPTLVDLIKSMIRDYISNSSALILCTITMKDDPENQAALSVAKEADPSGKRTIGVLTKPDTLQPSEEDQWVKVLKNKGKHHLALGYYITKQPSQAEVEQGVTFDTARENETRFFETEGVWRTLSPSVRRNVGTPLLTSALSVLLSDQIRTVLPDLFNKIETSLRKVEDDILSLASTVSLNPMADVIMLCERFKTALFGYVLGNEDSEKMIQANNEAFRTFKKHIRGTAPLFLPFTEQELALNRSYVEPVSIFKDHAEIKDGDTYNLELVRERIKDKTTRELPFSIPYRVKTHMMLLPIKRWLALAQNCFTAIYPTVCTLSGQIAEDVFGQMEQTLLLDAVKQIVAMQFSDLKNKTETELKRLFQAEIEGPYTQNEEYFSSLREKLIDHFQTARRDRVKSGVAAHFSSTTAQFLRRATVNTESERDCNPCTDSSPDATARRRILRNPGLCQTAATQTSRATRIQEVVSILADIGWSNITENELLRKLEPNDWEEEIVVMAETRAYFQVAYKRFIDVIPQAIDQVFIRPLADTMHAALITGLHFESDDAYERCKQFLAESPQKAGRRQALNGDKERLHKAKEALETIGFGQ